MLNLWEKSKIVLYFDDEDGDGYVGRTINNLVEEPSAEAIEKVGNAINSVSELPLAHMIVSKNHRYLV